MERGQVRQAAADGDDRLIASGLEARPDLRRRLEALTEHRRWGEAVRVLIRIRTAGLERIAPGSQR